MPVADFNEICARATTVACITEPEPGEKVDGLADRVMFRLAYRNFGDHESLVVNHTVLGGALGGVRWYEIRNPGTAPAVFQQGNAGRSGHRFLAGEHRDGSGGRHRARVQRDEPYRFSSIFVAGRTPADPPGKMFGPLVLARGGGVQVNSFKRWGDYSSMTVDPKDRLYVLVHARVLSGYRQRQLGNPRRGIQVRPLPAGRQVTARTTPAQLVPELRVAHVRGFGAAELGMRRRHKRPRGQMQQRDPP